MLRSCEVILIERPGCRPNDLDPAPEQAKSGLIDVMVENDSEAVAATQHLLPFFQQKAHDWDAPD